MHRILVLTSILPIEKLSHKKDENDILLITEQKIKEYHKDITFEYVYVQTYANDFLGLFSKRWKEFASICKLDKITLKDKIVTIFPIIQIPKKISFRNILYRFSIFQNKERLDKLIKEFNPTIIHAQNADESAYLAKYIKEKYDIPYIITVRGLNRGIDNIIHNNLINAKSLIAISPTQIKQLNKVEKNVNLIPHAVEDKFFIKNIKNNDSSKIKLVIIARLIKLKNIDIIINVLVNFKNFELHIIGDGPEKESLSKLVTTLDIVHQVFFLGRKSHDEILNLLPNYDLFVMPSFPETLGRVYFEVMASSIPIVAAKHTGIDGIITNGKEGFLIDHKSTQQLANCFSKIETNPGLLLDMSRNARELAKKYRWNETVKKYYNIYTA
ncbi:glycosyltransferase [Empedobacter sp. GD03865]|uniref:glycosyltransferase n=1 Tax=Empedobacter sp. GD03865 TaxID=2975392 RepID=UPI002448DA6D|nr:glycosyltransferase [Empedobacter sp. GD03865]MDH0659106.1 glycosyltransferase [Empedobacter sp. GD03865]